MKTKTLIIGKHATGPAINGFDDCYARVGRGFCPGHEIATWLNSLGDDHAPYYTSGTASAAKQTTTNIDVRTNWLRSNGHIVAKDKRLAELSAEYARLRAQIRIIRRRLFQAEHNAVVQV